jgi:hypothetical protein
MTRLAKRTLSLAIAAILICLASSQLDCRNREAANPPDASHSSGAARDADATLMATAPPTTLPAGPTSVRVSILMAIHKKYGLLARVAGNKNVTVTDQAYDSGKSWWDNPMVIHQDASFPNAELAANADSATITGRGKSANVSVDLTLVPHADITMKTLAASDCVKGTLTATITTISDYYDQKWTRVADARDTPITFDFDTSDKSSPLRETTSETRTMPPVSFERYIRDRQKWEPRSAWPATPKSGDWRCTIYVKDAKLVMTGYQYAQPIASTTQPRSTTGSAASTE